VSCYPAKYKANVGVGTRPPSLVVLQ
jgi:hypothetical protein